MNHIPKSKSFFSLSSARRQPAPKHTLQHPQHPAKPACRSPAQPAARPKLRQPSLEYPHSIKRNLKKLQNGANLEKGEPPSIST